MIVMTVFLSILNQMDFHLIQNQKEKCHHNHIPFNMKGNGNRYNVKTVFVRDQGVQKCLIDIKERPKKCLKKAI